MADIGGKQASRADMKKSTPPPTKADLDRFGKLYALGCIACKLFVGHFREAAIHHLNLGGLAGQKRRGHKYTIPLCEWHHQGYKPPWTESDAEAEFLYGPSLAKRSKAFRETFGDDDSLLKKVNARIRK